ncbi:MAG: TIGR01906 family membrane protein [Erysipelothrix sp.]|jgi:integral membrane protein (TIGR01906 family)|nr:TIGR01906 family membrane protein [Erysipelothrix sp.]
MKKSLVVIMHIAFMVSLFLLSIRVLGLEPYFFEWFYSQNDTASLLGMSTPDLMRATKQLLAYMLDQADSIQSVVIVNNQSTNMFNQKEIDHMVDVLALIRMMRITMFFSITITAILIFTQRTSHSFINLLKQTYGLALGILSGFIGGLTVFAIIDFRSFWIVFHQVLFSNDLWLLDPRTDRLVNMVPLNFFMTLVFSIIVLGIILNIGYAWFIQKLNVKEKT